MSNSSPHQDHQVNAAKLLYEERSERLKERRERLRIMLQTEEQQLLKEAEEKRETTLERQAKMRERAKSLRDMRETRRQQIVSEKLEQLFINQCEELRTIQTKRREEGARLVWDAQLRIKQEQQQLQQMKDRQFVEMCEARRQLEEQKESECVQRKRQETKERLSHLREQMDAAEQQRQQAKQLKEEEAQLLREQKEMLRLQEQREQQQRLQAQQKRKTQLNQSYRMKMKRLAKKQQEELALDMSILQQVLEQETDEKQDAAQRKIELREEQQRYRRYLAEELEKQKQLEEETEQLIEEKLKEIWDKREKQSQMERDARNRLMKDVMEAQSLQIQHKLELNMQKKAQLAREREDLIRTTEENKMLKKEEKRRHKETCRAYQADLQAQMEHQQQLRRSQKALEEREYRYGLATQQEYNRMKEGLLSGPDSLTTVTHSFRRDESEAHSLLCHNITVFHGQKPGLNY